MSIRRKPILKAWTTLPHDSKWGPVLAWHPSGQFLASGNVEGSITLWNVETQQPIQTIKSPGFSLDLLAFSPDGQTLASAFDGYMSEPLKFWNVQTGRYWLTRGSHEDHIQEIMFHPSGKIVGSVADTIKLWEVNTGNELQTLDGLRSFSFSPGGETLAGVSMGEDFSDDFSVIRIWDIFTGEEMKIFSDASNAISQLIYSPDGSKIISMGKEKKLRNRLNTNSTLTFWDVEAGQEQAHWDVAYTLHQIALNPDGSVLLGRGTHKESPLGWIIMWDAENGTLLQALAAHKQRVSSIAISPAGDLVATASADADIKLWKLEM